MGKKKTKSPNTNSSKNLEELPSVAVDDNTVGTADGEPETDNVAGQAKENATVPMEPDQRQTDSSTTDLTGALTAAQEEIAQLKLQLQTKDQEIAMLKEQLQSKPTTFKLDGHKSEDMQKLQERLQQLKREQAEADAAREAAWRQLKSVVNEISKLASPEQFAKAVSTPTA